MDRVMAALGGMEWWQLTGCGFLLGMAFAVAAAWALGKIVESRPYLPGPFARPDWAAYYRAPRAGDDAA